MSDQITCEFCFHSFSRTSNLRSHQKTALYCLKLQNKTKTTEQHFTCNYCEKTLSSKAKLQYHENKCSAHSIVDRLKKEITELHKEITDLKTVIDKTTNEKTIIEEINKVHKEYINKLEKKLDEKERNHQNLSLAAISRPTTNVKNTIKNAIIQNLLPIKDDEMIKHVPLLTIDHIKEGPEGYAKFALKHPLKNRIACTDVSRKKLAWKTNIGEIVYDTEGQALCKKFFAVIQEKSEGLFKELIKELGERFSRACDNQDQEEADAIAELTEKVQTWRREAFQASKGSANDLTLEFASYLCKMSVTNSSTL